MRILPDDYKELYDICGGEVNALTRISDTIEITDEELNNIVENYSCRTWKRIPFSQYLKELIELARTK